MDTQLLLCHHHRHALRNACERGFWMPVALPVELVTRVSHLTAIHPGSRSINAIAPITEMVFWSEEDGVSLYLPFLGALEVLRRPLPLATLRQQLLPMDLLTFRNGEKAAADPAA